MKALPAKLSHLLLGLPNITILEVHVEFQDSTPFLEVFKVPTNETCDAFTTAKVLPSVRELTIKDERWQFLVPLCSNLQSLTVAERYSDEKLPSLDFATLGRTNPGLKKLHCSETCERTVLEGRFITSSANKLLNNIIVLTDCLPLLEDVGLLIGYYRGCTTDSIVVCNLRFHRVLYLTYIRIISLT